MDESLVLCSLDLSGRPYLNFDAEFTVDKVGEFDTEMVKEFFHAIAYAVGMNLHIKMLESGNNHHMIEGILKHFPNHWTMQQWLMKELKMYYLRKEVYNKWVLELFLPFI